VVDVNEFVSDEKRPLPDFDANSGRSPSRWVEPMWCPESEGPELELAEKVCAPEHSRRPWALLLDGDDLRDVERMLDGFGAPVVRLRSGVPSDDEVPRRLVITSGNRALKLDRRAVDKNDRVVTLALLSKPSKTLARQVRSLGFDYVVERPVHPDALRHLLHAALFRGDERRCEPRFAAGYPIGCRVGWRRRAATLSELSRWGCSLRIADAPQLGGRLKVCLPAAFTGERSLTLPAAILRCQHRDQMTHVSVAFRKDPETRARVGALLPRLRRGPITLPS
jgi:hypothetical protein